MKLSEVKKELSALHEIKFILPNGSVVPEHFHVTEVGLITKNFIDCGGTLRNEKVANFQLWEANDVDHRLAPQKFLHILELSKKVLGEEDLEVEVEYQSDTIGKYDLTFNGKHFVLNAKKTNCLAKDHCGIPEEKLKVNITELKASEPCCSPGGGCC